MGRTVIVGDVHGCSIELDALLDRVGFALGDRLIFVGDLVGRGPDTRGVLDIARRTGAVIVRGNHEEKWLARRHAVRAGVGRRLPPVGRKGTRLGDWLRPVDWTLLETSPLYLDLPDHGLRVVHAGVVPGIAIEDQDPRALMRIRTLGPKGEPLEQGGGRLWGGVYQGPPHIVFGHNARPFPQLHLWATGIDTGCVYGGRLSAMILAAGERAPAGRYALSTIVSVEARRAYFGGELKARRVA